MPRKVQASTQSTPAPKAKGGAKQNDVKSRTATAEKARVASGEKAKVASVEKAKVASGEKAKVASGEAAKSLATEARNGVKPPSTTNGVSSPTDTSSSPSPSSAKCQSPTTGSRPGGTGAGGTGASELPLTRTQKRFQKEKLRKEEGRRLAEQAGVDLFPKDAMASERANILSSLQERLAKLPKLSDMSHSEAMGSFQSQRKELEEIERAVVQALGDQAQKVKRPEGKKTTATQIRQKMADIIKAGGTSEDESEKTHLSWLSGQLAVTVCWENYKKFQTSLQEMLPEIEERKRANVRIVDQAREAEKRGRVIDRIRVLTQSKNMDADVVQDDVKLVSHAVDIPVEASSVVLSPSISRKIERVFEVVIEPQIAGGQGGAPGQGRARPRGCVLWGESDKVSECAEFLKTADFSGRTRTQLERSAVVALIGRGGSGIRKIEEENGCFIHIDNNNEAIVYGLKDDIQKVLKQIQNIRSEAEQSPQNFTIPSVPTHTARALQALMFGDLRSVEIETGVNIRVVFGSPGGSPSGAGEGQVVIRGKTNVMEVAKQKVEEIMARLNVEEIIGESAALSKLFGGGERMPDSNNLASEFALLRESSRVVISRDQRDDSRLIIVGEQADVIQAKAQLQELLIRAAFTPLRMNIARQQLRIFDQETRQSIELETGAKFSVARGQWEGSNAVIELLGGELEKEAAREMVQSILETRASMDEFSYEMDETRAQLLRDKGQRLRELEGSFGVSITLQRDSKAVRVMGPREGVTKCKEEIVAMDNRIKEHEENMETKTIPIERSKAALIIGKRGATVSNIRNNSKVDRIDIQDANVVLKGTATAIAIAESMIYEVLESNGPTGPSVAASRVARTAAAAGGVPSRQTEASGAAEESGSGQKGRGGGGAGRGRKAAAAAAPAPDHESQLHFPSLDAAVLVSGAKRRGGRRRRGGGVAGGGGQSSSGGAETPGSASTPDSVGAGGDEQPFEVPASAAAVAVAAGAVQQSNEENGEQQDTATPLHCATESPTDKAEEAAVESENVSPAQGADLGLTDLTASASAEAEIADDLCGAGGIDTTGMMDIAVSAAMCAE